MSWLDCAHSIVIKNRTVPLLIHARRQLSLKCEFSVNTDGVVAGLVDVFSRERG